MSAQSPVEQADHATRTNQEAMAHADRSAELLRELDCLCDLIAAVRVDDLDKNTLSFAANMAGARVADLRRSIRAERDALKKLAVTS